MSVDEQNPETMPVETEVEGDTAVPDPEFLARKKELLVELEALVIDLRAAIPQSGQDVLSPQPDTSINLIKQAAERFTPEIAMNILEMFDGATREDLMDMDTWKGVWTMLTYSLQFQMQQLRERVTGQTNTEVE